MRIIDLSTPLVVGEEVEVRPQPNPPVYLGHECIAWDLAIRSHAGTYFETSAHLFRDGRTTEEMPLDVLIGPCAVCDLSKPTEAPQGGIGPEELAAAGRHVRKGDALLVLTGAPSRYFERDAARWMIQRGVRLLGADLPRYDTGFERPTGVFLDLFRAQIPIIAGLANLDRIAAKRCQLVVAPLRVPGVGTVPARVFALVR